MNTRLFTTWLVFGLLILGNVCHAEVPFKHRFNHLICAAVVTLFCQDAEDDDDDDDDVEVQIPKHVEAEDDTEYNAPAPSGPVHFLETFDKSWDSRWTITKDEDFKGRQSFFLTARFSRVLSGQQASGCGRGGSILGHTHAWMEEVVVRW